jgi:ABC-type transporter Mla subunit MlaD
MGSRAAFFRVGLLIVIGLGAIVGLAIFLGGDRIRHGLFYETYFSETVQGLEVGAPVKFRGVTLGKVTEIGLVAAEYLHGNVQEAGGGKSTSRLVFVRFEVDPKRIGSIPDLATSVANGLRARLASQGITGLSYLELDVVAPYRYPPLEVPWTPNAEYIPSMPSTLMQVQDAAQSILTKLQSIDTEALSNSLIGLLNDLREELAKGDVHAVLADAQTLLDTLNGAVKGANLPAMSAELQSTLKGVNGVVNGPQLQDLMANASAASKRLAQAAEKIGPLLNTTETAVKHLDDGRADLLAQLAPILRDARAAVANLRETTDALRAYPAQTFLGGPPPRPKQ